MFQGKIEPEMNTQPSQMKVNTENGSLRDKVLILDAGSQYAKVKVFLFIITTTAQIL